MGDEGDAIRQEIGIEKDLFGLLGGRETYVLDSSGTVVSVHNSQFDPESHVQIALKVLIPPSPSALTLITHRQITHILHSQPAPQPHCTLQAAEQLPKSPFDEMLMQIQSAFSGVSS